MAATQPRQLARLQIPPNLGSQQPFVFNENAPVFSPSLPTAIHVGMHNAFPMQMPQQPLQTPMQPAFFPRQPPGAPARPVMHRAHPSMVQLAAAGILPPPGMPMTPLGQVAFPGPMAPPSMLPPPFVPRNKRTQSISTGGPPKALLGGPQRKVTPVAPAPAAPAPKPKKMVVNLPQETMPEGEQSGTHPTWARHPLPPSELPAQPEIEPPEVSTCEPYPPDAWRHHIPPTVDVFLPGKTAWDDIKKKLIEEKLEKLGVEKGSGAVVPHIHAPHARAASISSPADPALLYFKLNKLQQSQNASGTGSLDGSLTASPQPPINMSPSPNNSLPPRFQNIRHGHSMSLVPTSSLYNPTGAFNPFGPAATLGSDQIFIRTSPGPASSAVAVASTVVDGTIHAPQGRVPTNVSSLAPPASLSRPESRPDFTRGFGLDVTEEEEEPVEDALAEEDSVELAEADQEDQIQEEEQDGVTTVAQSRAHSRHVSKISAPLSLRSVGGTDELVGLGGPSVPKMVPSREPVGDVEIDDVDGEAVEEWTGSEDLRDTSDDESIGEWSNPSDEERARQDRVTRRMMRRAKQIKRDLEAPRRLPNFPRPPDNGSFVHLDDDVISNPSEEGESHMREQFYGFERYAQYSRPPSNQSGRGRPLPPVPHSRTSSAHFSYHDPALAHSREGSDQFNVGKGLLRSSTTSALASSATRTESLNPHAKPFVFGPSLMTTALAPASVSAPSLTTVSHVRGPSASKPLNVAAPEFKPGGFTFQPPPGVPHLDFAVATPRPLPVPPTPKSPVRATQGREKRQRRGSEASGTDGDGEEEEDEFEEAKPSMTSFKFPPSSSDVHATRHSAPASPPSNVPALSNAKPLTFSGFPNSYSQDEHDAAREATITNDLSLAETTMQTENGEPDSAQDLPFPPTSKPRRAPIPLDFKHPVSHNTVPAGLFKALVNNDGEERTRRTVRSRLSSRDLFEFEHSPRPSLDDLAVPSISQRKMRNRIFTDPGLDDPIEDHEDVYIPRRSSLPPRHVVRTSVGSASEISLGDLERRAEMQLYEERLEALLDEKVEEIKKALETSKGTETKEKPVTLPDTVVKEVVTLFRAQLSSLANRERSAGVEDAHGEFDFEVLKDIIEQTQAESRSVIQQDLEEFIKSHDPSKDFRRFAEELSERTIKAIVSTTSQITMHLHTMEKSRGSFSAEREAIAHDILKLLTPTLVSMRPEPIDYEDLTVQLTQAVKPHISQLIDLASDKRETAGLIVDRLVPMLPSLHPPPPVIDMDSIVGRLSSEIRKIIGPLDAHEMKEQVSDLVVERLDSRLAVRDRAFNTDALTEKVKETIDTLLGPMAQLKTAVDVISQNSTITASSASNDVSMEVMQSLSDWPGRLSSAVDALNDARSDFKVHLDQGANDSALSKDIEQIQDILDQVADEQKKLVSQNSGFSEFCQDIIKHINGLPEVMVEATKVLQNAYADIISRDTSQKDTEEIRRLTTSNAELQVQLVKARGAHGQIRVEKDVLVERVRAVETERDQLRGKLDEAQSSFADKLAGATILEARKAELENALEKALERIKSSDVSAQRSQERISNLEKTVAELTNERQLLKAKVDKLELSATFTNREKDSLTEELVIVRSQKDDLLAQQTHWDELRSTTEQIQTLVALMQRSDNEELKRSRDRIKTLEVENASLQRRMKDQETKTASNERTAQTARQSLAQAQQRAAEWEKRANEYESDLNTTRDGLEREEQAHRQSEEDRALLKMQLEERDAEERLAKDRESKLRDQIAALEAQMSRVQAEADLAKKLPAPAYNVAPTPRLRQNGYTLMSHTPVRPESRSTVFVDSRVPTPTGQTNGANDRAQAASPPAQSVWNSIHAPAARPSEPIRLPMTPKMRPPTYYRPQIPSPTPSNVSAAPTLGDDGWWH